MAVSIGLNVAQTGQDIEMRTATVTVQVIAYFTAGSYNATSPGPLLKLYVDGGLIESAYAKFNASKATSGSEVIYTTTWVVDYNSDGTKTLNVSAIYESGVSSGTVTASTSKELIPISSSSGGGSSGEGSGSSGSKCYIYIYANTGINYKYTLLNGTRYSNSCYSYGSQIEIDVWAQDGYELTNCTIDGVVTTSTTIYLYGDIIINATAQLIDNDGSGGDNGGDIIEPNIDFGCTVNGQTSFSKSTYSLMYRNNPVIINLSSSAATSAVIKFTTPNFTGVPISLDISLGKSSGSGYHLGYALCTSDSNFVKYATVDDDIEIHPFDDTNCIYDGEIISTDGSSTIIPISIPINLLNANTVYYLFIWLVSRQPSSSISSLDINQHSNHIFTINCSNGLIYLDNQIEFAPYQCYIDNGVVWSLYTPYIDNGINWVLCT